MLHRKKLEFRVEVRDLFESVLWMDLFPQANNLTRTVIGIRYPIRFLKASMTYTNNKSKRKHAPMPTLQAVRYRT